MRYARTALILLMLAGVGAAQPAEPGGPAVDRVGLPDRSGMTLLRTTPATNGTELLLIYANGPAASVTALDRLPYPNGAVFAAEWHRAVPGPDGQARPGELLRIDVMRRGQGFGEAYGAARSGEWEYVQYRPDGSHRVAPGQSSQCASCHRRAGAPRDFVFRGRFAPSDTSRMGGE
jgi:hypothetical protein